MLKAKSQTVLALSFLFIHSILLSEHNKLATLIITVTNVYVILKNFGLLYHYLSREAPFAGSRWYYVFSHTNFGKQVAYILIFYLILQTS